MLVFYLLRLLLTSLWGVLSIVFLSLLFCFNIVCFFCCFMCRFHAAFMCLFFCCFSNCKITIFFSISEIYFYSFTKLAVFHSQSWPCFVHQVGRISFTKLAVFRSPSWPYFIHQVGRISFTKLAVLVLWFLQRLYCRRLSVFFVCRVFDCAEYGAGDG